VVVEPEMIACACGACERVKISEDVSERLDVVPVRFRVIVTRRPKYACKACHEGIVQAVRVPSEVARDSGMKSPAVPI